MRKHHVTYIRASQAYASWISDNELKKLRANPEIKIKTLVKNIKKDMKQHVV